ncbi:MAG: hypothetical protein EXS00_00090 [Phycisphaerales bacterium]|nr:hypothetical protein [Phycisphaerales bacterium]
MAAKKSRSRTSVKSAKTRAQVTASKLSKSTKATKPTKAKKSRSTSTRAFRSATSAATRKRGQLGWAAVEPAFALVQMSAYLRWTTCGGSELENWLAAESALRTNSR